MELHRLNELERICDPVPPVRSFESLRVIVVVGCHLLNDLLSSNLARRLSRLKEIRVESCSSMKSIIVSRESESEEEIKIQLRVLDLHDLPVLQSFYNFKQLDGLPSPTTLFNKKILFSELEVLQLSNMEIEKIWDVDHLITATEATCWFQNLTSLKLYGCDNLSYVFTFSMVQNFSQLKQVEVYKCDSIEEIVSIVERDIEGETSSFFPKLESVELSCLPKLKRFCHVNSLECPSLQTLMISDCPQLNAFISANDSTTDPGANSTPLFNRKIVFPKLEILYLSYLKIEKIWDHLATAEEETTCWFQNLTSLVVSDCNDLTYLFTFSMANLKDLQVSDCGLIEEIVASMERSTTEDIQLSFPKLENIKLEDLSNLKRFCEANLLKCQLLRKLDIHRCYKIKTFVSANDSSSSDNSTTLFTEKVAIPNIEELRISGCDALERLPMNERETCRILRSVVVSDCQSLTSIFPTSLTQTPQQLERLEVRNCDKFDLFQFNNLQQLYDAFAKVSSNLKYCYLERSGLTLEYEDQRFQVKIDGSGFEVPPIFFELLQSVKKLNKVVVSNYSIIQLFPCETDHLDAAGIDTQAKTLVRIGHLQLTRLSNMKQIWSEHSPLKYHVIPEVLELSYCNSLLSLAPPSTTLFKHLTDLIVTTCSKLKKLIASSSTVKILVNLKKMSVRNCDSLEEIVVIDDQWDEEVASNDECIVFEKLEVLDLRILDSLTSFCSAFDCNFRFPSLNRVIVYDCPKMKFFSQGDLSTPKLKAVEVEYVSDLEDDEERTANEARWEGDLNSTIRQMFTGSDDEDDDEDEDDCYDRDDDDSSDDEDDDDSSDEHDDDCYDRDDYSDDDDDENEDSDGDAGGDD